MRKREGQAYSGSQWLLYSIVCACAFLAICVQRAFEVAESGWGSLASDSGLPVSIMIAAVTGFWAVAYFQKGIAAKRAERAYNLEHPKGEDESYDEWLEREKGLAEVQGDAARRASHEWGQAILCAFCLVLMVVYWVLLPASGEDDLLFLQALTLVAIVALAVGTIRQFARLLQERRRR